MSRVPSASWQGGSDLGKRIFDITFALVGLILLAPVLAIIAILIQVTSGAPIIFRHERVGLNGRIFVLCKFRTMTNVEGGRKNTFEPGNTRRITAVGRWLRRSKLDELPQLWNVLMGDMALVGPRPEVAEWVQAYPDRWALVHSVRPGVTDPASILFRGEEEILAQAADPKEVYRVEILPRKLTLYEDYVRHHSIGGDVKVIFLTLAALCKMKNS